MQTDATPPPFPSIPERKSATELRFDDRPLAALAARRRFSIRAAGIGWVLTWLAVVMLIVMLEDVAWGFSSEVRLALGIFLLAGVAIISVRIFLLATRRIDARFMTREVEAGVPAFGQLLTTARDPALRGPNVSPVLRQELMIRANRALLSIDERPYLGRGRAKVSLVIGIISLLVWLSYLGTSREGSLAFRRLLHPFTGPTFTTVHIATPDPTFTGQRLPHVEAILTGRLVSPVTVEYPGPDGAPVKVPMTRISSNHFEATLPGSEQSFEYRITGGDSRPAIGKMENADPAKWVSSSAEIALPEYIGRPKISQDSADIDTVEDSEVTVRMKMSLPMRDAAFELPDGRHVAMAVNGTDLTATFKTIPSEKLAQLKGTDIRGHKIEPVQFKHVIHPDELPHIEWVEPKKDAEATAVAEIPLRLRIKDDFGIASFGVVLQVRGEEKTLLTKEYEAKDLTDVSEIAAAALEDFPLTIRDNVRLYAWAKDRKPRDGARGNSELRGIDILPFKRKWVKGAGGGGQGIPMKELVKLEELIREQRRILSDAFQMPAEAKASKEGSGGLSARELKLQDRTAELFDAVKDNPNWKRDDVALLNAAADQMGESSVAWGRPDAKLGFDRADAALSNLLELRKNLLLMIMESKSEDGKPADEKEAPEPLSKLAEEAERLAREERDVSDQLRKDPEGRNLAAPRRQQQIAKVDAGELFADLMKHPDATPLVRSHMGEAEKQVGVANGKLNSSDPATAPPELDNAAERLDEVARHLRALDAGQLDETLAAMSEQAKQAAEEAKQAADGESPAGEKGEGKKGEGKDPGEGKGKGDGESEAKAEGEGKGKGSGEGKSDAEGEGEGEGKGEGRGKGSGKGRGRSPSGRPGDTLADAARQAAENDDVLKALAAKEESKDGDTRLDALRKEQGTDSLEKKLNDLAEGKGDPGKTGQQLADLAQALDQERAFRQQSRLENLTKAKEEAGKLKKAAEAGSGAIEKAAQAAQEANGGAFSFDLPPAALEKAKQAGKPSKQPGEGQGGGADFGSGGASDFKRSLESFHDPELHLLAGQLHESTNEQMDPRVLSSTERRLAELIEQVAGVGRADNSAVAAPSSYRRTVEDYFRALSDDLGDDAADPR